MNTTKSGLIVGAVVACAILQGCKAPKPEVREYMKKDTAIQKPATEVTPAPAPVAEHPAPTTVTISTIDKPEEKAPPVVKPVEKPLPEPVYTEYTVRSGDYLSKLSKRYNIRQSAILAINPGLNPNKLYVGKKIRLPGRVEVAEVPVATKAATMNNGTKPPRKLRVAYVPYTGATKEYAVKNGDYLGKIAQESGITVRALKELNGLVKNDLRIGQKLKVPAEKQVEPAKVMVANKVETKGSEEKNDAVKAEATAVSTAAVTSAAAVESAVTNKLEAVTPNNEAIATPTNEVQQVTDKVESAQSPAENNETKPVEKPAPTTHTVRENEDLFSIAIGYDVSPSALKDLNNLNDTDQIPVGTVLKLPAGAKARR